jgi:TM2 domain-containing membrane protein YozV
MEKNKFVALLLSYLFGIFGLDRIYLGCITSGIFKLLTLGGFGIWYFIDFSLLLMNSLQQSSSTVLCDGYEWNKTSILLAFWFSIVILFLWFLKYMFRKPIKEKGQKVVQSLNIF